MLKQTASITAKPCLTMIANSKNKLITTGYWMVFEKYPPLKIFGCTPESSARDEFKVSNTCIKNVT